MAVAVIGVVPGGNAQMDQERMKQLGVSAETPPAGGLARLAGPSEDGYKVVSVWESEAAWEAFKRDRMDPFFSQSGQPAPSFEVWPLDMYLVIPTK